MIRAMDEDKNFGFWIGSECKQQCTHRVSLVTRIDDEFAKKPAVRAAIYERLYQAGKFDDWVEGYGIITVIDKARLQEQVDLVNKAIA